METILTEKGKAQLFRSLGELFTNFKRYQEFNPRHVFVNKKKGIVVVEWGDGSRTKSTCDSNDNFDAYVGFCTCLAKKMYEGKKNAARILRKRMVEVEN